MEQTLAITLNNIDVPLLNEQISALSNVNVVNGDWKMRPTDKDLLEGLLNMLEVMYDDILAKEAA
jgi:hypothetical protein